MDGFDSLIGGLALLVGVGLSFAYRSVFLIIIAFIFSYPLFHLYYLYTGGDPVRIVDVVGMKYYSSYLKEAFYGYFLCVLIFHSVLLSIRHKKLLIARTYTLTPVLLYSLIVLLLFMSVISYPWLFGLAARREMLLPGNGWVSIYIGTYLILLLSQNSNSTILKSILFILLLYFIVSGERVNNMLYVVLLVGLVGGREVNLDAKRKGIFALAGGLVLLLGYVAGNLRGGGDALSLDFFYVFNYITVIESLHVYLSSFWYVDNIGNDSSVLLSMIYSFIPFHSNGGAGSPYFFENIIASEVSTVGGGMFVTEGYLAFGLVGLCLWSLVSALLIKKCFISESIFLNSIFVVIFALAFRFFWYGWEYIITPVYVMFLYLLVFFSIGKKSHA